MPEILIRNSFPVLIVNLFFSPQVKEKWQNYSFKVNAEHVLYITVHTMCIKVVFVSYSLED